MTRPSSFRTSDTHKCLNCARAMKSVGAVRMYIIRFRSELELSRCIADRFGLFEFNVTINMNVAIDAKYNIGILGRDIEILIATYGHAWLLCFKSILGNQ